MVLDATTWIALGTATGALGWALHAEWRLRRHRVVADNEARHALGKLLANAAHELRTPLTGLLGLTEVAAQPSLPEDRRQECLDRAVGQGQQLLALVNDLFDYVRLRDGKLIAHPIDVELSALFAEVVEQVRPEADFKGLLLAVRVQDDVPAFVRTDPDRLRQALRALMQNGVKFTRRGHVGLHVTMRDAETLRLRINDTGPGIDRPERQRVFDAFRRGELGPIRRHGGLGLGLALAAGSVRELGGRIQCEANPGGGAAFVVDLPVGVVKKMPEPTAPKARLLREDEAEAQKRPGKRGRPKFSGQVLLVEDSRDNQLLIRTVLKQFGLDSTIAENGQIALNQLEKSNYDLVLMDMQMPVLDGYSATNEMRQGGNDTPVVALTAHALKEDRDRCLESGCNDFLTKPLNREELTRVLGQYLKPVDAPELPVNEVTPQS